MIGADLVLQRQRKKRKMNKKTQKTLFSSKQTEWITPQEFYIKLMTVFGPFTLDPAATKENSKCNKFFTIEDDGLKQSWEGEKIFCNPPYKRGIINQWVKKGFEEGQKEKTLVVMLLSVRSDVKWFKEYVMNADEIYFVNGRLKFGGQEKNNSAPFPSMIVVFDGFKKEKGMLVVGTIDRK